MEREKTKTEVIKNCPVEGLLSDTMIDCYFRVEDELVGEMQTLHPPLVGDYVCADNDHRYLVRSRTWLGYRDMELDCVQETAQAYEPLRSGCDCQGGPPPLRDEDIPWD